MKDRFSKHASEYATFRPTYPEALYEFILQHVNGRQFAWDCGTGNGQVARELAKHFNRVEATDISASQIENAAIAQNIHYAISPSEKTKFQDSTFDLVTVGQAVHWFNIPEFFREVKRVTKPRGVVAIWGYSLLGITPAIDEIILDFYANTIGPFWDSERKLVDDHYRSIPFPFDDITPPNFEFTFEWTIQELKGYITTWSSVQKYIRAHGNDPVVPLIEKIKPMWRIEKLKVIFPLFIRCGVVNK